MEWCVSIVVNTHIGVKIGGVVDEKLGDQVGVGNEKFQKLVGIRARVIGSIFESVALRL
jgi:hypothetical protein